MPARYVDFYTGHDYPEGMGNDNPDTTQVPVPPVTTPQLRRSSRRARNMPAKYRDFCTGHEYDEQTSAVYQADKVGSYQQHDLAYQEEIVDYIYAVPLPPSFSNCIAWWTGSA